MNLFRNRRGLNPFQSVIVVIIIFILLFMAVVPIANVVSEVSMNQYTTGVVGFVVGFWPWILVFIFILMFAWMTYGRA